MEATILEEFCRYCSLHTFQVGERIDSSASFVVVAEGTEYFCFVRVRVSQFFSLFNLRPGEC